MEHRVSHDLDLETATRVTNEAFESYRDRFSEYSPTLDWESEREAKIHFNAKGMKIEGHFTLEDRAIAMDLDVPFIFRPFRKKAIEIIENEIQKWIDKAKAGEI